METIEIVSFALGAFACAWKVWHLCVDPHMIVEFKR